MYFLVIKGFVLISFMYFLVINGFETEHIIKRITFYQKLIRERKLS